MSENIRTFRYQRFQKSRWRGVRLLTMRHWPRYVTRAESRAYFDAWLPTLAPSEQLRKQLHDQKISWATYVHRYRQEMKRPDARHTIGMLAAVSRKQAVGVGCGCLDERFCHRSILRELIAREARRL
jgi:uncharacterized protein YeaO (DUF488 family)